MAAQYKTIKVTRHECVIQPHTAVYELKLIRPEKFNCIDDTMWSEMQDFFTRVEGMDYQDCRIIFICGDGASFCSGLDLECLTRNLEGGASADVGYRALEFQRKLLNIQKTFTMIDECRVPVIAAMHGPVIGAGVGLAAACDMRVCSEDTFVTVKDIEMGAAAEAGMVARLVKAGLPVGWIKEFLISQRMVKPKELKEIGFVNYVVESKKDAYQKAFDMCRAMGRKSPVAVIGTKRFINFSREHTIEECIEQQATWNAAMLQSNDFITAVEKAQIHVRKHMLKENPKLVKFPTPPKN